MALADKKCVPCEGRTVPLFRTAAGELLKEILGWRLSSDARKIERAYSFKNFRDALAFVNRVGAIAEEEGHHPDISFGWGRVVIALSTHAIGGLSENDFVLAAKIDKKAVI